MNNDENDYSVSFSVISWLENALMSHGNVLTVRRYDDIIFEITRKRQNDVLIIFCADEYACGITFVHRVLAEYPNCNCISVGGGWNGYTTEAKEYCLAAKIGLFVSEELLGALWKKDYWRYVKKDSKREPSYFFRNS